MPVSVLRVLTYHRVLDPSNPGAVRPDSVSAVPAVFDRQMRHLARRYRAVSAEEVLHALRSRRPLPARAVLVTFDDAYRDFGDVAWPILRRHGLPATVFVPTAFPDQPAREFWWDRLHRVVESTASRSVSVPALGRWPLDGPSERAAALRAIEAHLKTVPHADAMEIVEAVCASLDDAGGAGATDAPVLGWDALRELAGDGVTLGAHTRTHAALTRLPLEQVRAEVRGSLEDLRREIGAVAPVFAYPFGAHDDAVVGVLREEGVELALTCLDGHNRLGDADPLRLRRTNITTRTSALIFRARLTRIAAQVDVWRHRHERASAGSASRPGGPPASRR